MHRFSSVTACKYRRFEETSSEYFQRRKHFFHHDLPLISSAFGELREGEYLLEVSQIRINEPVTLDPDRLVELCVSLGEAGTEALVTETMTQLSIGVTDMENAYRARDLRAIRNCAVKLSKKADHIGLVTFARVCGDVADCAELGISVPLAATLTRLRRLADKTLTAAWDMTGMSL